MTQLLNHFIPRVVMAGLKGGCGKTTLSLGLIASYKQKGLDIIPFKKGPDYIDAGWLSCAAGRPCYNLDAFLIGKDQIIPSFIAHSNNVHCAIIEGNRGLYDGMDEEGTYSTAELAKILKAPVLLIIDCTKTTRTTAAMVLGCQRFDPSVEIKGIILNQIAGSRHESVICASIRRYSEIPVVGAIPRLDEEFFPERHMGLTPYQEHPEVEKAISAAKEITQRYLDLDAIWKIANEAPPLEVQSSSRQSQDKVQSYKNSSPITHHPPLKIGVIKDSAFQFYYPENLEELQKRGAELVEISPLSEKKLPEIDALYIGGGFPETHAIALAENIDFRNDLRQAVEYGLPVYAECGGLMYLGESLIINNKTYPMVSIFPVKFSLEKKPQAHGYTMVEVGRPNPYYTSGTILKGHEFHYSRIFEIDEKDNVYFAFRMKRGQGIANEMDGLCYKNVLATYTHLHALGAREWVEGFINTAMFYRMNKSPITKLQ